MTVAHPQVDGFRSLESETRVGQLPLDGRLPDWLHGSLLRTGPAKWEVGDRAMNHWFDGFAMLHRFGIADGKVSYANRFLETRAYRAAKEKGEIVYSEFATDPCRSLFQRITSLFSPKLSDNANVNLTQLGERFISMTETPIPVQFDAETLETVGVAYETPGMLTTAHPHLDRESGGMLNYAAKIGARNRYRFFLVRPDGSEPAVIAERPVREPAYMHSFGLSERWLVLAEFPFVVNPISIPLSGRPYIENYRWKPELGTRFTLIDRSSGEATGPFETDACFGFHHINSYEENGELVVDACVFADAGIVQDLYLERLRAGKPVAKPELRRFRISPGAGSVSSERLTEEGFDLPRTNYGRFNERPYRYAWGVGTGESGWLDRIVKADLETGETSGWSEPDRYPGEPVFVAAPDADAEDAGVLLSIVFDSSSGSSFLLVLDAADLSELARAEAPHHIPFGFHGQFSRS
ncbi:MAG: carotenoid oxygenase family protein [Solirubrobacterales bacterium]